MLYLNCAKMQGYKNVRFEESCLLFFIFHIKDKDIVTLYIPGGTFSVKF